MKPVTIPNTFATQGGLVPAAELDANYTALAAAINDVDSYSNYAQDSGAINAYVVNFSGGITFELTEGVAIQWKPGHTNNAASTLSVAGTPVTPIVDQSGNALTGGELISGRIVVTQFDGTNWQLTASAISTPAINTPLGQVQVTYVSATQIKASPFNGNQLTINGANQTIPSGGVTAANTGIFLNGVGGQSLGASTLYYVYLFLNTGTPTVDFSTTAYATDTVTGMPIKTGDATRTLLGLVFTNGSSQFTVNNVRSWFNDPGVVAATSGTATPTLVTPVNATSINFTSWANEIVHLNAYGTISGASNTGGVGYLAIDAVDIAVAQNSVNTSTNSSVPWAQTADVTIVAVGNHNFQTYAYNSNNNGVTVTLQIVHASIKLKKL